MLLKNKKGFTLVELLLVIAIIGIVSPLIFIILISGIEDYSSTTKYLSEQYSVMEVTRHIKQDVEEAKTITYIMDGTDVKEVKFEFSPLTASGSVPRSSKTWKIATDTDDKGEPCDGLWLKVGNSGSYVNVVRDLDLTKSKFSVNSTNADKITRLILVIKPTELNKRTINGRDVYNGRNVNEEINTEFSVRYKINKITAAP